MVFLDVIVNQVETQHELTHVWATRAERLEKLFVYECICSSTPK